MEQLAVNGKPFTTISGTNSNITRIYPTEDGSFFLIKNGVTENTTNGLYHFKKDASGFSQYQTIFTLSSSWVHESLSTVDNLMERRGFINGEPVVLAIKNNSTGLARVIYVLSLAGSGSLLATIPTANSATAFGACINSQKGTIVWNEGTNLKESDLLGNVSTSAFTSSGTFDDIQYAGNGNIAVITTAGIYYKAPANPLLPSAYTAVLPNGVITNLYGFLQLSQSVVYRVVTNGTFNYYFYEGMSTASPLNRIYASSTVDSTADFASTRFMYLFDGEDPQIALLNFRHIRGHYELVTETLETFPDYSYSTLCKIPGDFDPIVAPCTAAKVGNTVYVYYVNNNDINVRSFDLGDTQAATSQNTSYLTLVPGESVSVATNGLWDFQARNPDTEELFFHTTYPISQVPESTVAPYNSLRLKFTDDSLQRLAVASQVKTFGDSTFTAEVPRRFVEGAVSAEYVTSNVQRFLVTGGNDQLSVLNTKGNPLKVERLGSGSTSLAIYSARITIPGSPAPEVVQFDSLYYWKYWVQCPFSNNLYLLYFASSLMHVTYIDMTTRTVLWTHRASLTTNPSMVIPFAAGELRLLTSSPTGATVNCNTKVVSAFASNAANREEYYKHFHPDSLTGNIFNGSYFGLLFASISEGRSKLIIRNWDMSIYGDETAFITRDNYISDVLSIRYEFGSYWYYMRAFKMTRTATAGSTAKTSTLAIPNAIIPVSLHNGQLPSRKGIFQYSDSTAFLAESWPDKLKITPFTVYSPDDSSYSGLPPVPTLPATPIILARIGGWMAGG